ncbi:hypothetical protein L7F22_060702 [Adiantum nelumboides]|nr:hypothetical protein [Adiantum nelumboides]
MDKTIAKKLWDALCAASDGKSASNKVFLMKTLMRMNMKEGSSVSLHLNEFNNVFSQLTSKGLNFDDEMKAIFLLCSLPSSWDTFNTAISNSTPGGTLMFSDVTSALVTEEIRRQSLDASGHGDAYMASGNRANSIGGLETFLQQLERDDERRVEDATGRVPLFLKQWSEYTDTPDMAWKRFINMKEVSAAKSHLQLFIPKQLIGKPESVQRVILRMYLGFITGHRVEITPDRYDCRYLYIVDGFGRCVCAMYRDIIAQILQEDEHLRLRVYEWKEAIECETVKEKPNLSLLGFMIEQHMITDILSNGIPLFGTEVVKCKEVHYFHAGAESRLPLVEGCILYEPNAFNYRHVDAIVRQSTTITESCEDLLTTKDVVERHGEVVSPATITGSRHTNNYRVSWETHIL